MKELWWAKRKALRYLSVEMSGIKSMPDKADKEFKGELLNDGASPEIAELMFKAVDIFGDGLVKTSFSWGFARK